MPRSNAPKVSKSLPIKLGLIGAMLCGLGYKVAPSQVDSNYWTHNLQLPELAYKLVSKGGNSGQWASITTTVVVDCMARIANNEEESTFQSMGLSLTPEDEETINKALVRIAPQPDTIRETIINTRNRYRSTLDNALSSRTADMIAVRLLNLQNRLRQPINLYKAQQLYDEIADKVLTKYQPQKDIAKRKQAFKNYVHQYGARYTAGQGMGWGGVILMGLGLGSHIRNRRLLAPYRQNEAL